MRTYLKYFDKKLLLVFFIAVLFNTVPQFYLWDHISDDAFISFRYADRMLNGHGLTFNDGEKVEGFSSPLWNFAISFFSKVTQLSLPDIARALGLISSILLLFFIYLISKILLDSNKSFALFLCISFCLFFTPGFHVYNTAGLEGPLLSLLLVTTVYFSITNKYRHLTIAAFLIGLVGIIRPEGLLYGLLWLMFTYKFNSYNIYSFSKRILIVLLPSLLYVSFRLIYYGEILPNTAFAKPSGTYSHIFGTNDNFLYLVVISIPLTIIILYHYFKFDGHHKKFILSVAGLLLANFIFIVYAGGDWMFFGRFFLPVWPILLTAFFFLLLNFLTSISTLFGTNDNFLYLVVISIPLSIIILYHYFKFDGHHKKFILSVAGLLLANFIFIVYAGGDWMFFGRFFLPVWPILLTAFFFLLLNFLASISTDNFTLKYLTFLCLITFIITQLLLFKDQWFIYKSNDNVANLMKGKDQLVVGQWLNQNFKPGTSVATFRLGGISYGAPKLVFYDTFGLTDKEVTNFRRGKHINYNVRQNPVIKRKPNILAIINYNGFRSLTIETIRELEYFLENNYVHIRSFSQGTGVFFEIWVDKEEKDKILF